MAESAPVQLNKEWLEAFIRDEIGPFKGEIKKMGSEGAAPLDASLIVPPLADLKEGGGSAEGFLTGQKIPLAIGLMAGDTASTNGGFIAKALTALVEQLTGILKQQGELFDEIEENLQSSIEELFGAQSGNLEKIDGKKFVDFFEDVDDILSQGSGTGNGNED